jgi:LysM repeat protein
MNISKLALLFFLTLPLTTLAQKTATLIYIDQYKDIAISEMKRTGIPASITLAQGIIESNSGESNLALNFKNHFGIKCKSDWKGETTYQDDDAKQECFRAYPNSNASYIDHSNFLKTRPNYAPLFELDPVDDSAWAYGLKKAGYATAADYPKKLLKVINDFELSQYNFPELGFFEDEDTPTQKIDTSKKIEARKTIEPIIVVDSVKMDSVKIASVKKVEDTLIPLKINLVDTIIKKDTTAITSTITDITNAKDSINSKYIDTIQLSNIKGITSSDSIQITAPTAINGIGALPTELAKDSAIRIDSTLPKKDTSTVVSEKPNTAIKFEYPKGKFKANQLLAIYASAGSSFLELATTYNIALYKLYGYNDLEETDLVPKDQILYLVPKRKEVSKKVHLVAAGESLYDISQNEGIQLNYLQAYNAGITDKTLVAGTTLILFKTNEAPKITTMPVIAPIEKPVKKEMIKKSKLLTDTTTKKTEIKDSLKKKPLDFIKNISVPNFLKRKKNN